MAEPDNDAPGEKLYEVGVTWNGDGTGAGVVQAVDGSYSIDIGAAADLGGCGRGANPEELLLAAVGSCFIATWAIFLKKLAVVYAEPSLAMKGFLAKDPAGGFRMTKISIGARVPAQLLQSRRRDVEKTLQLAEKYCIISKVAKAALSFEVEILET
jgi:peroxiredoxin-like protein